MAKPEVKSLNDFVRIHGEAFTSFELWLTDELTDYLVAKRNLDKSYTSIVIDLDREEPVYGVKDNKLQLRFNGRFSPPSEDKSGTSLQIKPEQWIELCETWFKEQELEVIIGDKATDFIKFTAILPVLEMPETSPEGEEEPEGEKPEGGEEPPEGGEPAGPEGEPEGGEPPAEAPEGEEEEEEPEGEEAPKAPEGEEDAELKEFEQALGI